MQFSNNDIKLFGEAGITVENKDYTKEEAERLKIKVTDFIMSKSIKDIDKVNKEDIKTVIAAAGGAAHLAGVIASRTLCPVIGVPIYTKNLNGIDSLYSTIQMPSGVPVATVGINASKNAGLLAIKMLGLENLKIKEKLIHYNQMQANKVINKNKKIHDLGYEKYLEEMRNE